MNKTSPHRAHPWHGISAGAKAPEIVNTYIEIVPTDTLKYEMDKESGILKVDRPQLFSNVSPSLYGFIPQTFCGDEVGRFCMLKTGKSGIHGDGDPMDICVLSEKTFTHGDVLVRAVPIGGFRMIDKNQADDKIIAVLFGDSIYGGWKSMSDCPASLIDRLKHYFLTYKLQPGSQQNVVEIADVYDREEAHEVIRCSIHDYQQSYER
jgi:inorganic pyrophosphatase